MEIVIKSDILEWWEKLLISENMIVSLIILSAIIILGLGIVIFLRIRKRKTEIEK